MKESKEVWTKRITENIKKNWTGVTDLKIIGDSITIYFGERKALFFIEVCICGCEDCTGWILKNEVEKMIELQFKLYSNSSRWIN